MKFYLLLLIFWLTALSAGAAQQRSRRAAVKPPDTGSVTVMRSATLQVFIASDAVSIFSYLSDQGKLTAWLADQAILDAQFGGKYHFRWKNQEAIDGVVTEYVAANTLAMTWKNRGDVAETQVRFKLSPQGGRTLVELEHQGLPSTAVLDKAVDFWTYYLQNLKSVIEDDVDLRHPHSKLTAHSSMHP